MRSKGGRSRIARREVFELEYWASPYKEGGAWINEHVPGTAAVLVPLGAHVGFPRPRPTVTLATTDHVEDPDGLR